MTGRFAVSGLAFGFLAALDVPTAGAFHADPPHPEKEKGKRKEDRGEEQEEHFLPFAFCLLPSAKRRRRLAMSSNPFFLPRRTSPQVEAVASTQRAMPIRTLAPGWLGVWGRALLLVAALLLVVLIALVDHATGPQLSCSIFYLIPVAACAWWGGFSHGILLALAGSLAWHTVEQLENPTIGPVAALWNGVVRFGTLALVCSLVSRLHAGVLREWTLARTDPLTGAANARTFYEAAVGATEWARRMKQPLTLAYLDLDDFKKLNDRFGHAVGDESLQHLVTTVQQNLRCTDLLARLGGDEFALLLPGQGPEGAAALLTRLQTIVSREMSQRGWPVTLSVGAITFLRPGWDVHRMIQHVDALMYGAKRQGKGRVEHTVVHEQDPPRTNWRGPEKRANVRVLCQRTARVRADGQLVEGPSVVRDISVAGIGLHLGKAFPTDTVLIVEPLTVGPRTLLARVVRVDNSSDGWLHGCELATHLDAEELGYWLHPGQEVPTQMVGENKA
jgi:diguanylate cyclase (GGDEF)-like protein